MKKLFFTEDFSSDNVANLQAQGYTLRNPLAYKEGDFIEDCDAVAGDVPEAYAKRFKLVENKSDVAPTLTLDEMNVAQLREVLDESGVEYDNKLKKPELLALALKSSEEAIS